MCRQGGGGHFALSYCMISSARGFFGYLALIVQTDTSLSIKGACDASFPAFASFGECLANEQSAAEVFVTVSSLRQRSLIATQKKQEVKIKVLAALTAAIAAGGDPSIHATAFQTAAAASFDIQTFLISDGTISLGALHPKKIAEALTLSREAVSLMCVLCAEPQAVESIRKLQPSL